MLWIKEKLDVSKEHTVSFFKVWEYSKQETKKDYAAKEPYFCRTAWNCNSEVCIPHIRRCDSLRSYQNIKANLDNMRRAEFFKIKPSHPEDLKFRT
jgi:hypothetical protein